MSLLYMVCDPYANLLGRGPTQVTNPEDVDALALQVTSTNANGDFAPSRLIDSRSDLAYMANSILGSYAVWHNVNIVADHAVKIGGVLGVAWTRYTPSVGDAAYQDVTCRAGEAMQVLTTFTPSGGQTVRVQIQNLATGNWLTTSGTWVPVASAQLPNAQSCITNTVGGTYSLNFTTESVAAFGETAVDKLRLVIWTNSGNVQDVFSNIELIPSVNCAWVYGHNFTNQFVPVLETSPDGSSWTVVSTGAIRQPGFYFSITPTISRWWRIRLTAVPLRNNNVTQPIAAIGEAFVGYASSPTRIQKWDWQEEESWPQLRQENSVGHSWVYRIAQTRRRQLRMTFAPYDLTSPESTAALRSLLDDLWLRSLGGAYPIAVIARDARPDLVFGRIDEKLSVTHSLPNNQDLSLVVNPFPVPVVGP